MSPKQSRLVLKTLRGLIVLAGMALLGAIHPGQATAGEAGDAHHIVQIIKATWERPDNPVDVAPVALSGDYAVADWIAGERGGRALLKKTDGAWRVILCSGDGIRTATGLLAAGVPQETAGNLESALSQGEAAMPAEVVRKFSLFEGSVPVEGGAHGPHDHHGKHEESGK